MPAESQSKPKSDWVVTSWTRGMTCGLTGHVGAGWGTGVSAAWPLAASAETGAPKTAALRTVASDPRRLFYGDDTGQVWTLDTRTWRPLGTPLGPGRGGRFALSPDEAMLATTGTDGSTQLWDVASGRPIGSPLQGTGGGAAHARSSVAAPAS